jgi:hypothetical protein
MDKWLNMVPPESGSDAINTPRKAWTDAANMTRRAVGAPEDLV